MHQTLYLVAVASIFPLMALVLALPFYVAAWLRGSSTDDSPASTRPKARGARPTRPQPRGLGLAPTMASLELERA
jgi:hypothetical protein